MSSRIAVVAARLRQIPWRSITAESGDCSILIVKTFCVIHVVNEYALSAACMRGQSMVPAFNITGDVILVDRVTPGWGKIKAGDVVSLRSPQNPTRIMAKRVTGGEGDSVSYLAEPGAGSRTKTPVVPKGHVWVQGDNIYASRDSREYGPVANGLNHRRAFLRTIATGKEFHQFIQIFSSDLRNLPILRGIGDLFSNLFNQRSHCGRSSTPSHSMVENLVVPAEEPYEANVQNLFPNRKEHRNYEDEHDPHAVFNVLDMVLVETMERLRKLREGFSVLGRCCINEGFTTVLRNGFRLASSSDCAMIRALCSEGKVKAAMELYTGLLGNSRVPDLYTYNFLLNGLCKLGDLLSATCLLERMSGVGVSPNSVTYNTLVEGYCSWGNIDKALDLVSSMPQSGVNPNIVTCNILVHALSIRGLHAEKLLAEILERHENASNVITLTILMDGCFRKGNVIQALQLWNEMSEKGMEIDRMAYNVLINGFCLVQDMKGAYRYCSEMLKKGFIPDVVTFNTLISGFSRKGNIDDACDIHSKMKLSGLQPDGVSYKLIIHGLYRQGNIFKAVDFLHKMINDQLAPDSRIWNLIINCYGRYGDVRGACSVRDMMVAMGVTPNVFTYNALIHAHVKSGNIRQAILLKKEMLADGIFPDAVTYNLIISGVFNSEYLTRPFIPKMWSISFLPDIFTYTELIKGLCIKRRLREAGTLLNKLLKSGLPVDHVPFQILIKMYCKMGRVAEALELYEKMTRMQLVGHFSMYRSLFIALRKSRYYIDASLGKHGSVGANINAE